MFVGGLVASSLKKQSLWIIRYLFKFLYPIYSEELSFIDTVLTFFIIFYLYRLSFYNFSSIFLIYSYFFFLSFCI